METSKNLSVPSVDEFSIIESISRRAATCGLYGGLGNENRIFMVLLAAKEMGIPPMQALNGGLWNIQGKIEISSRLMCAMIRRAGHSINIKQCDGKTCILEGKRKDNGDSFCSEFYWNDAVTAGLSGRENWKKYAQDMLYSRALSRLARRLFPDVIGTAYVEGEIEGSAHVMSAEIVSEEIAVDLSKQLKERKREIISLIEEDQLENMQKYISQLKEIYKSKSENDLFFATDAATFVQNFNIWKEKNIQNS